MSVTIADLLQLPCLHGATVLAGKQGLSKTVSAVSVLEYSNADDIQDYLLSTINFVIGELAITCFASIKDNVSAQCVTLRRLAEIGEVGLILYYVGVVMPRVDPKLIEIADSLHFPLICMPNRSPFPRYSEVISEVMGAIIKDQMTDTFFQADILERISKLPIYQRSIGTVMGMLSDRLKISLLLTDANGNLLNSIYWPRHMVFDAEGYLKNHYINSDSFLSEQNLFARCDTIDMATGSRIILFILKHDEVIRDSDAVQIVDVIRLCLNLWSQHYGDYVLSELVQAILKDEPFKMRRIAELFNIDVRSIHNMWVMKLIQANNTETKLSDRTKALALVRNELSPYCKTIVADIYDQDVVALMDNPVDCNMIPLAEALDKSMDTAGIPAIITVCLNLNDTAEVRRVYLKNQNALTTARYIYPNKRVFTQHEVSFAEYCKGLIEQGEETVRLHTAITNSLAADDVKVNNDLSDTLTVFLLDAGSNAERCSRLMHVHINTIKYRLNRISDRLSFRVGHLPETLSLYTAAALRRILQKRGFSKTGSGLQ